MALKKLLKAKKNISLKNIPPKKSYLDDAIKNLETMLLKTINDEREYQDYIKLNPWVLGLLYDKISSHEKLDDKNVPDFTGVRVRDATRDIIEIKSPFLLLFGRENKFRAEFNDSWNQVERYLTFVRHHRQYLYEEKGLSFDNPRCYLIIGYDLTTDQIKKIRDKEEMNPSITVLTYNDLLAMAKSTVNAIVRIKKIEE